MDEKELTALVEDLRAIKGAVRKHDRVFKEIMLPQYFGPMSLYTGTSITVLFAVFQYLVTRYGGYGLLPKPVVWLLWGIVLLIMVSGGIIKWVSLTTDTRRIKPGIGVAGIYKEFFIGPVLAVYSGVVVASIIVSLWFGFSGQAFLIIPYLAVLVGLIWNLLGGLTGCREYFGMGFWLILTGSGGFFVAESYPFAMPALTFGIGIILFGILGFIARNRNNREKAV
jgi:hypothetical protein